MRALHAPLLRLSQCLLSSAAVDLHLASSLPQAADPGNGRHTPRYSTLARGIDLTSATFQDNKGNMEKLLLHSLAGHRTSREGGGAKAVARHK